MTKASISFEIDDNKSFDENVASYLAELEKLDPKLFAAIKASLSSITGSLDKTKVWNDLLAAIAEKTS